MFGPQSKSSLSRPSLRVSKSLSHRGHHTIATTHNTVRICTRYDFLLFNIIVRRQKTTTTIRSMFVVIHRKKKKSVQPQAPPPAFVVDSTNTSRKEGRGILFLEETTRDPFPNKQQQKSRPLGPSPTRSLARDAKQAGKCMDGLSLICCVNVLVPSLLSLSKGNDRLIHDLLICLL